MRDIKPTGKGKPRFNPQPPFPEDLPEDVKELYQKYAGSPPAGGDEKPKAEPPEKKAAVSVPPPASVTEKDPEAPKQQKPQFGGSKVPVASVHVPRQQPSPRANRVQKRPAAVDDVVPEPAAPEEPVQSTAKARPLFAAPAKAGGEKKRGWWPSRKISEKHMKLGQREKVWMLGLLAVVLLGAGLAAVIFLPKASVDLTLQTAPLLVDEEFTVAETAGAAENNLPGQVLEETVTVEGSAPVTGTKKIGEKAAGQVQIINRTTEEQPIKEESRLVTDDGKLYFMERHAIVPPGSGPNVGAATVTVVAEQAGEEYNAASGRLNFAALDSSAQSVVYAEIVSITGGSGDEVTVVTEEDMEQAREAARQLARDQVEQQLQTQLQGGFVLLEESWDGEISEFETEAALDEERQSIPFRATVTMRVMGYDEATLEEKLKASLEEQIDEDFMLFPGQISHTKSVDKVQWEERQVTLKTRVTHTTIPSLSVETLHDKLAGRERGEAEAYLQELPGVQAVTIDLWPFWAQRIPRIDQRVAIELVPDREP